MPRRRNRRKRPKELIPDTRCFGAYRCPKCNRQWMSANSWDKFGQKCFACKEGFVLPYNQKPLNRSEGLNKSNPNKRHPRELCQKCTNLGHYCGK